MQEVSFSSWNGESALALSHVKFKFPKVEVSQNLLLFNKQKRKKEKKEGEGRAGKGREKKDNTEVNRAFTMDRHSAEHFKCLMTFNISSS